MKGTTWNLPSLGLAALALLAAAPAGADTYNVDRFDDSTANGCTVFNTDDCALRGAIIRANAHPGDDVVRLQAGTYTLSIPGPDEDLCQTGDLDVTDTLLIVGRGPERTIIDAGGDGGVNDRVFDVRPGVDEWLTLRGVTVTGGFSTDDGGGIRAVGASLRLETCVVSGNHLPTQFGAAIYMPSDSPNRVEVVDSWITHNVGLHGALCAPSLLLERSTVSFNDVGGWAVFIWDGAPSSLVNSTVTENTYYGVLVYARAVTMHGCTLADNSYNELYVADLCSVTPCSVTLSNTLIDGDCFVEGQLTTLGGNLESPGHTCGLGANDLEDVPLTGLSELGFFGGPAPVRRPEAGSPALDQAIADWSCSPLDQRGLARPLDGDGNGSAVCDIGAVELAGAGELFVETFDCGFTTGWSDVVP